MGFAAILITVCTEFLCYCCLHRRFGKLGVFHGDGLIMKDIPDLTQDDGLVDEFRFLCTFLMKQ